MMGRIRRLRRIQGKQSFPGKNGSPAEYRTWYTDSTGKKPRLPIDPNAQSRALENPAKRVEAVFFRTDAGREPLRNWLTSLPTNEDCKRIREDIKTVEFGWPIGMPTCRPLGDGVFEVRTNLAQHRIARILFYIDKKGRMVRLHGFIKKTQKTPDEDLDLARQNKIKHQKRLQ
jgi:phage-related protein